MKRMKRNVLMIFLLVCTGFLVLGITTTAAHATLYFVDDVGSLYDDTNLWELDTSTGAAKLIGFSGVMGRTVGLSPSGSSTVLYGSKPFGLLDINTDGTGYGTQVGDGAIEGLAFDSNTGILYGAANNYFFTIDPLSGTTSALAGTSADIEGLAYGKGGIYGLGGGDTYLYFYDINLGTWSTVGDTGLAFDNAGLAYDTDHDILYALGKQDTYLYSIDPLTAALTLIGDTGFSEGGGLAYVSSGFVPVAEPATMFLLGLGMIGLAGMRRKI